MGNLLPYLGQAVLILIGTVSVLFLVKLLKPKKIRYKDTEVIFDSSATPQNDKEYKQSYSNNNISIYFTDEAVADAEAQGIKMPSIETYVKDEIYRHPRLLEREFTSLPLIFGTSVLLLSWTKQHLRVEKFFQEERFIQL